MMKMMKNQRMKITTKGDLFDEDQQFHFSQGPEEDDGDDYEDHYQSNDSEEGESDRDGENLDVEKTMFVKSIGSGNVQESTKKKLVKVSAMEKELRELQADPEIQKESPKVLLNQRLRTNQYLML